MSDCVYAKIYWTNKGRHQRIYDRLQALVPDEGEADTPAGELMRLMSNVYYDVYNNGGCNLVDGGRSAQLEELQELAKSHGFEDSDRVFRKMRGYALRQQSTPHHCESCTCDDEDWDDAEESVTIEVLCQPLERLTDFCVKTADRISRRKAA